MEIALVIKEAIITRENMFLSRLSFKDVFLTGELY